MGSKARFAKELSEIMSGSISKTGTYIEPFAGGMNMISKIQKSDLARIANDSNPYLIALFKALQQGWEPPDYIEKDEYTDIKNGSYPEYLKGWVGFNCSYSGKWFGGFAGKTQTRNGIRNYQEEAKRNVMKQIEHLRDVIFMNQNYSDISVPFGSVVYCDPPYANTTDYFSSFDSIAFWCWVREVSNSATVFVSEYEAPDDFTCIWEKQAVSSLSANGKLGGNKVSTEKLFILKGSF